MHAHDADVDRLAELIWDYHHVGHRLEPADAIVVLGSHDPRVAEWGARLYLDGYAPLFVISGGLGNLTLGLWDRPEADVFADAAARCGVPREQMLLERASTNTGENFTCTARLFAERGLDPRTCILVHKPYMERRTLATAGVRWPGRRAIVTSPPIAWRDYPNAAISREDVIHIMIGDLQRIRDYPARGWQTPQPMPDAVWQAAQQLMALGYTRHGVPAAAF